MGDAIRGNEEFTFPRLCDVFHWPGRPLCEASSTRREPDTSLEISWSMIEPGFRPISRRTLQSALTSDAFAIWFILGLPIRSAATSRGSAHGFSRVSAIFRRVSPRYRNDKFITRIYCVILTKRGNFILFLTVLSSNRWWNYYLTWWNLSLRIENKE